MKHRAVLSYIIVHARACNPPPVLTDGREGTDVS